MRPTARPGQITRAARSPAARTQAADDGSASSTQRAADDAEVASAESDLEAARDALDAATLRAPFSGTVSAVGYEVGDQAGTGANAPAANGDAGSTPAITLISPHALEVDANVSASDVGRLHDGLQVQITPTGGGETAYGTVAEVGVIATAGDSGAAQFPVTVDVTGKTKDLYAGSTASLDITVKQATDVLAVSTQALHDDNGQPYVYVIDGSKRTRRDVRVGETYGMQTEIVSGLKEGDVVELVSFTAPKGSNNRNPGGTNLKIPEGGFSGNVPGGGQGPIVIQGK